MDNRTPKERQRDRCRVLRDGVLIAMGLSALFCIAILVGTT